MRTEGIDCMVMLSDDAEAEEYAAMLPHFSGCCGASLEHRYRHRGETEKCNRQKQLNFRDGLLFY